MRINWKLRAKNKVTLTAIIVGIVGLVYQILRVAGVTWSVDEQEVLDIAAAAINLLCLMGIVVDPTTEGISDSERAMSYDKPA